MDNSNNLVNVMGDVCVCVWGGAYIIRVMAPMPSHLEIHINSRRTPNLFAIVPGFSIHICLSELYLNGKCQQLLHNTIEGP